MKIFTIVGARPQFIKAASVSRAIFKHNRSHAGNLLKIDETIIHTGQHYDHNMSQIFFKELEIPTPDYNLEIGSGSHGLQTGQMLIRLEELLRSKKPDLIIVYGDTNSTLAGALAAVKLHIPIAHVEAGLRSFNRMMPEEHNRVLTDHCSNLLFCPTQTAVENLLKEGITSGVHLVGDVMYDSVMYNVALAGKKSKIVEELQLDHKKYALATLHRAENTDNIDRLNGIFTALEEIAGEGLPVILPLHPRTRKVLNSSKFRQNFLRIIDPVPYLDMLMLEKHASLVFTDSGGVQKEAYWMKIPCVTLRDETEWIETIDEGWNVLAGADKEKIIKLSKRNWPSVQKKPFDCAKASDKIIYIISQKL